MGWMLWPTGIGWKARSKTARTGTFTCRNPKCKGKKSSGVQQYKLQQHRNWIIVFYVPVLPMNHLGASLQCASCKTYYSLDVLTEDELRDLAGEVSAPAAALPAPPSLGVAESKPAFAASTEGLEPTSPPPPPEPSSTAPTRSLSCEACGSMVGADDAFCGSCGRPVQPGAPSDELDAGDDSLHELFGLVPESGNVASGASGETSVVRDVNDSNLR